MERLTMMVSVSFGIVSPPFCQLRLYIHLEVREKAPNHPLASQRSRESLRLSLRFASFLSSAVTSDLAYFASSPLSRYSCMGRFIEPHSSLTPLLRSHHRLIVI